MEQMANEFDLAEMCQLFEISRSGYYSHLDKSNCLRRCQDRELIPKIRESFLKGRQSYGSPRIQKDLAAQGMRHGKNRIARIMRQEGLRAVQKKRFVPGTTQSDPALPIAPNWLAKIPTPDQPDQVWLSDITYIPTHEGWVYLAGVLDACSRKILGWHAQDNLQTDLVTKALNKAIHLRKPSPGLLHHSDRGSQYASGDFQSLLANLKICCSMSRSGNCYDNAQMESFWATLKTECFGNYIPKTKQEAILMIFNYIETFYNKTRLHSSLGYRSPLDFEAQLNYRN